MELDVRRLRVLREVALRGTITAAAESLGFTPSAVSQQLSALERESRTALLERAGRGVRLTEAGQVLVKRTEAVLTALEEAQAALEESREAIAGELRVAASGSVARALVVPVAAAISAAHPQLRVSVLETDAAESERQLRLGQLDVAVGHEYSRDHSRDQEEIGRVELFAEDMLVAAPAGRMTPPVRLADLAGAVWAAEPAESSCGRAVRSACRAAGFEPDVRYVSSEPSVLLSAVLAAGAVALLPRLSLTRPVPCVEILPVAGPAVRRQVFAAHRRGNLLRPAVALLLDRLQEAATNLPRPPGQEAAGSATRARNSGSPVEAAVTSSR